MTTKPLSFTQLLPHIQATYPEQPRVFHIIATRYYVGAESLDSLRACGLPRFTYKEQTLPALLSAQAVQAIIDNR